MIQIHTQRVYSKSTEFYARIKSNFFDANDSLLVKAELQNQLYNRQPKRENCKICYRLLPKEYDFISHHIKYFICDNCGHLNGEHEDTESFVESLYVRSEGEEYSKNYLDKNYLLRTESIYTPKLDFLHKNLPEVERYELLDVGCGAGYFVYAALMKGINAKGLDVSHTMVNFGNQQLSLILQINPLTHCAESEFISTIANSKATVISAIGVIEHLRNPIAFFDAFNLSKAKYLFYSVPMFSFSVMIENLFTGIFPRQLSGGHTHLFTEQSIEWLHNNWKLNSLAEWRFGTDVMDLYRSMRVSMAKNGVSSKMMSVFDEGFGENIDQLQSVFDENHFCSEIHCLVIKQ